MHTPSQVIVSGLTFGYPGMPVFMDFSLRSDSSLLVLKGPSGSGKTTLLKLLFGALEPQHVDVLPRSTSAALLLQEDGLFPWLSGWENITAFIPTTVAEVKSHPLYPVVADFIDRRAHQMSFGQRRAIELLRVLLLKSEIIYMDEPFNYLDDQKVGAFVSFLSAKVVCRLLIITTHRHDSVLDSVADRFYLSGALPYTALTRK